MGKINKYDPDTVERWGCSVDTDLDEFNNRLDADCMEVWKNTHPIAPGYKRHSDNKQGGWFLFLGDYEMPLVSISATVQPKGIGGLKIQIDRYETDNDTNQDLSVYLVRFLRERVNEHYQVQPEPKSPKRLSLNDYREETAKAAIEQRPETKLPKNKNGAGRPKSTAHKNAIQRLSEGESKTMNKKKWAEDYKKETGIDPRDMASGEDELYRKNVWKKFINSTGKN